MALLIVSAAGMLFLYPALNGPAVLLHRAQTFREEGRGPEADAQILLAVSEGLRRPEVVLRAAEILLDEGQVGQALSLLSQTLAKTRPAPAGLAGQMAGLMDTRGHGEQALTLLLQTAPDGRSREESLYLADLLRRQGRHAEALAEYGRLLEEDPTDATAALGRVETLAWEGELETALPLARELVRARPDDRAARLTLARILNWSGRTQEAEAEYRRLLGEEQ